MKRILFISVILAAILLTGCAAPAQTPEPTGPVAPPVVEPEEPTPTPTPTPTPEPTPQPEFRIDELKFKGTGDDVSDEFELPEGVTLFAMTHSGSANFIIELLSSTGETIDMLVNEIGAYTGGRALGIQRDAIIGAEPGTYILGITADGKWTVMVGTLRNVSDYELHPEAKLPVSFSGTGDGVTDIFPVEKDGVVRFTLTHDGDGNFLVTLLNAEYGIPTLIVNEIGSYEGTKAVGFKKKGIIEPEPGIYLVDVVADGNWSIEIN